jgi:asparagine synthase (glutamine-hydrolysing)
MCGIAGIIDPRPSRGYEENRPFLIQCLSNINNSLQHRGPDHRDTWINSSAIVGFTHCRLSIIDLSAAGNQPLHYLDRYTIVHNGEIYNYVELKKELQAKGYSFQTATDTEVIAAAYDAWEDECVDHFDGMFAFAIWDEEEQELFAARDRFGEKPFYYFFDKRRFVFASEIKAFWPAEIEKRPNLKMLFNFITIGYANNPNDTAETFYENIYKLPPATSLKYYAGLHEIVLEKYWDIDLEVQNTNITDAQALEQFEELFKTSVQHRLRSDVAIGTSLSGGLDSSSVVAVIHEMKNPSYSHKAFSTHFPSFDKDELQYSQQVSQQFGLQHFVTQITSQDLLNDWEKLLYHHDEPFGSASVYAQYKVFELAKDQNVKVLLDGQGADETLAGYTKYYKWYWQELFHQRKLLRSKELKAAKDLNVHERFGIRNVIAALFPDLASVILEHRYLLKAIKQKDLTPEFVKYQSKEAYYSTPAIFSLNGVLYFNSCIHGLEELLQYADRNSMAHGTEVRLPFLNHQLVEFIFSLPPHFKIRNGWTKWLIRTSMKDRLPSNITWRKDKIGFEPPQKAWMQDSGVIELIHEAKKTLVKEHVLHPQSLGKAIEAKNSHEADNYDWRYLTASVLFK